MEPGYIADFHARAIRETKGVELVGVCDANLDGARLFAKKWGDPPVFDSLGAMLEKAHLDSLHLLVPPNVHYPIAKAALEAGVNVFVEKPMCVSTTEADELLAVAEQNGVRLAVCHNMLFAAPYQHLRQVVRSGILGPLDHISIDHFVELAQIRFGPFDSWMLRAPENIVLEIGPHIFSALIDLVGRPDDISVTADRSIDLPSGNQIFRRWRIQATVGRTSVCINMNFGPGFSQRTISVRGLFGSAFLDFDSNICTVDHKTTSDIDFDRYKRSKSIAKQIRLQSRRTLTAYLLSVAKLTLRGAPYPVTFIESIGAFYSSIRAETEIDQRIDGVSGREVVDLCNRTISAAGSNQFRTPARVRRAPTAQPSILVIGGAGFIGREVIGQLLSAGYFVRAMIRRTSAAMLEDVDSDHLELFYGDMRNPADLQAAMQGIEFVYHLATAQAKTWDDRLRNEVEPIRLLGEACLTAKIKRLVYTGTIDSYYAGARGSIINEETPLDSHIGRRNYYARAKAAAEEVLIDLHRTKQLPVVIFRPGIVIGKGGNPFHFGVGMWSSDSTCLVWGDGLNALPFVLVSDVATALVRANPNRRELKVAPITLWTSHY